ncbi:phosphopantetheine-binding protein [Streptomyces sp. NPDC055299]
MPSSTERRACELLVARHLVLALANRGIEAPAAEELIKDASLRTREFSLFGLNSLDWIALATWLEDEISAEMPDQVLLSPEHRCVAGWSEAIFATRTAQPEAHQLTQ